MSSVLLLFSCLSIFLLWVFKYIWFELLIGFVVSIFDIVVYSLYLGIFSDFVIVLILSCNF